MIVESRSIVGVATKEVDMKTYLVWLWIFVGVMAMMFFYAAIISKVEQIVPTTAVEQTA